MGNCASGTSKESKKKPRRTVAPRNTNRPVTSEENDCDQGYGDFRSVSPLRRKPNRRMSLEVFHNGNSIESSDEDEDDEIESHCRNGDTPSVQVILEEQQGVLQRRTVEEQRRRWSCQAVDARQEVRYGGSVTSHGQHRSFPSFQPVPYPSGTRCDQHDGSASTFTAGGLSSQPFPSVGQMETCYLPNIPSTTTPIPSANAVAVPPGHQIHVDNECYQWKGSHQQRMTMLVSDEFQLEEGSGYASPARIIGPQDVQDSLASSMNNIASACQGKQAEIAGGTHRPPLFPSLPPSPSALGPLFPRSSSLIGENTIANSMLPVPTQSLLDDHDDCCDVNNHSLLNKTTSQPQHLPTASQSERCVLSRDFSSNKEHTSSFLFSMESHGDEEERHYDDDHTIQVGDLVVKTENSSCDARLQHQRSTSKNSQFRSLFPLYSLKENTDSVTLNNNKDKSTTSFGVTHAPTNEADKSESLFFKHAADEFEDKTALFPSQQSSVPINPTYVSSGTPPPITGNYLGLVSLPSPGVSWESESCIGILENVSESSSCSPSPSAGSATAGATSQQITTFGYSQSPAVPAFTNDSMAGLPHAQHTPKVLSSVGGEEILVDGVKKEVPLDGDDGTPNSGIVLAMPTFWNSAPTPPCNRFAAPKLCSEDLFDSFEYRSQSIPEQPLSSGAAKHQRSALTSPTRYIDSLATSPRAGGSQLVSKEQSAASCSHHPHHVHHVPQHCHTTGKKVVSGDNPIDGRKSSAQPVPLAAHDEYSMMMSTGAVAFSTTDCDSLTQPASPLERIGNGLLIHE